MNNIREYLNQHVLLFDGAFGTYYNRIHHSDTDASCEVANITDPKVVRRIHGEYIEAGATAIKTNTFGAYASLVGGTSQQERIIEAAIDIAEEAVQDSDKEVYIFGDLGQAPGETEEEIKENYLQSLAVMLDAGVENFLFETLSTDTGVEAAVRYIREQNQEAFIIVSYGVLPDGSTADGLSFQRQMRAGLQSGLYDIVGLNCVSSAPHMKHLVEKVPEAVRPYISALPNAGYPVVRGFKTVFEGKTELYVSSVKEMVESGVRIVGGCCGTTPKYIQKMRGALEDVARTRENAAEKITETTSESKRKPVIYSATRDAQKQVVSETKTTESSAKKNELLQKMESGKKVIAVELDSPLGADSTKFLRGAKELKDAGVDTITIADNPIARARMDSTVLAARVKLELGLEVIPHMTCRDRNANATKSLLLGGYAAGVRNVLIVTGDPIPTAERNEVQKVYQFNSRKLIHFVSSMNEEIFSGEDNSGEEIALYGALNVNARNFEIELGRAVDKVKEGAIGFLTQPAMTEEALANLRHAKEVLGSDVKILGGIIPVISEKNGRFMESEVSGIHLSEELIQSYHGLERDEAEVLAEKYSVDFARQMADFVDGFYLITPFGRTGLMARIVEQIKNL